MSKRHLQDSVQPVSKQQRTDAGSAIVSQILFHFDTSLYDELVLCIFSHLSWTDLCSMQSINRNWARLTTDNQLWKDQFLLEFGRMRLRGGRGFVHRKDGREMRPLPYRAKDARPVAAKDNIDWKCMFRISCNWRKGRCSTESVDDAQYLRNSHLPACLLLTGSLVITSQPTLSASPLIYLRRKSGAPVTLAGSHRANYPTYITNLTLDQSPPLNSHVARLACFYATGEFSIFSIDHAKAESSRRLVSYIPQHKLERLTPIQQASYHHPLLATLSKSFQISLYNMCDDNIVHTQTLSSYTSFPPTSLVLSAPTSRHDRENYYKLVLAYAVPVFPSHWSVAVTELRISAAVHQPAEASESSERDSVAGISGIPSPRPCTVISSRSSRAYEFPPGWVDEAALQDVKAQWRRKVARVADTQTDGKWVVLAPADRLGSSTALKTTSTALQLYRLHLPPASTASLSASSSGTMSSVTTSPRLTFVRFLHGHVGPVVALSLADGRCVSLGADGSLWVWDLEKGWNAEVQSPQYAVGAQPSAEIKANVTDAIKEDDNEVRTVERDSEKELPKALMGSVVFDERRIVSATAHGVELRDFDV